MNSSAIFSLFAPYSKEPNGRECQLSKQTQVDLGLDIIAHQIAGNGISTHEVLKLLTILPIELDIIQYRQAVAGDLLHNPELKISLQEIIPRIFELIYFNNSRKESDSLLLQAIWRLGELELYVECICKLHECLSNSFNSIRSDGLIELKSLVEEVRSQSIFDNMIEELPKIREGLRVKKSVTIGVNLDEKFKPKEATLLSIHERPFTDSSLLRRLFGSHSDRSGFVSLTPVHKSTLPGQQAKSPSFPLSPLFQDIEHLLRSLARPVIESIKSFLLVNTRLLRNLGPELAFYVGSMNLIEKLQAENHIFCTPQPTEISGRVADLKGFFNLQLALRKSRHDEESEPLVLNDVDFDDTGRILILTGPNQGGKTTFTQGVGIAQVLFQAGLPVPARYARISPADCIVTHFPAAEQGQLETGRFAEEALRLAKLFKSISASSLVLLNETLSSTSPGESLYIAEDIVKSLRLLGTRSVFSTHLHELSERIPRLNGEVSGKSSIASIVAEVRFTDSGEHLRTFKIRRGPSAGKSYARDIAEQYGISFEQIKQLLSKDGKI